MGDEMDRVQARNEEFQEIALEEHRRRHSAIVTSRTHCLDCGNEIPLARRLAVNGCLRCIDCQELLENWRAL